jgi:transposase-like protein
MTIVTIQLPEVKSIEESRPKKCPYCPGKTFQRWGSVIREVKDPHVKRVIVYRYRCCLCHQTFRHYPQGVTQAQQTQRLQILVAIGWRLGMSHRGVAMLYEAFGVKISRMTVWRDVQLRAKQQLHKWKGKKVRVAGVDGAYVLGWKKKQPVLVVIDMGTGEPLTLGYVDEKDPEAVRKFLEPLVQEYGISVIVTDDLSSYKKVADDLQLEQQICQFHVRRWVGKALHDLKETLAEEWLWMLEEVRKILSDLPIEGDKRLLTLYRQLPAFKKLEAGDEYTPEEQLRSLVLRLSENWSRFRVFDWQENVPWTNNPTEQGIGKMKMRARTVRGYKNWEGMFSGLMVAGSAIS